MKALLLALKDKKCSHDDNKGKSALQTIATELYKVPKRQTKKTPKISNKLY